MLRDKLAGSLVLASCGIALDVEIFGTPWQLAQNWMTGDIPLGDRMMGTEQPGVGQDWSVKTY